MLGRRVGAALIDIGVVLVLALVIGGIFGDPSATGVREKIGGKGPAALFILLAFLYYLISEIAWAQTIGKRALKLKVAMLDGTKPGAGAMFVRNLVRVIDALPAFYVVGLVTVLATGQRRQRLGDLAAKTHVVAIVDDAGAPPDEPPPPPTDDDVLASVLR